MGDSIVVESKKKYRLMKISTILCVLALFPGGNAQSIELSIASNSAASVSCSISPPTLSTVQQSANLEEWMDVTEVMWTSSTNTMQYVENISESTNLFYRIITYANPALCVTNEVGEGIQYTPTSYSGGTNDWLLRSTVGKIDADRNGIYDWLIVDEATNGPSNSVFGYGTNTTVDVPWNANGRSRGLDQWTAATAGKVSGNLLNTKARAGGIRMDMGSTYNPRGNWNAANRLPVNLLIPKGFGSGPNTTGDFFWKANGRNRLLSQGTAETQGRVVDAVGDDRYYRKENSTLPSQLPGDKYQIEGLVARFSDKASSTYKMADCIYRGTSVRETDGTVPGNSLSAKTSADEIRLDMSGYNPGGNWNRAKKVPVNLSNLKEFGSGTNTTVDVSWNANGRHRHRSHWTAGTQDWVVDAVGGTTFRKDGNSTLTLSQLPGDEYQIEVLVTRFSATQSSTYKIGGSLADRTYRGTPVVDPWNWGTDGTVPGNWMIWNSVAPVSGSISIDMTGEITGISAMRILAVPEPVAVILIFLFGGIMLGIRRFFT